MLTPKEITKDSDNGVEYASFDYYTGIEYANQNNLKHSTSFDKVRENTHYLVCCGDVMIRVNPTDYPEIPRRII